MKVPNVLHRNNPLDVIKPKERSSIFNQLKASGKRAFATCDKISQYLTKTLYFTRGVLNASLRTCYRYSLGGKGLDIKVNSAITHLKVFSIIGIPFSIAAIPDAAKHIYKNVKLRDKEGSALASLSFVLLTADLFDSVSSVINSGLTLASKVPIGILSSIGMPLSFGLVGLGTVVRSIKLAKTQLLYRKLQKEVFVSVDHKNPNDKQIYRALSKFLDKNLGVPEKKMKRLKNLYEKLDKMSEKEIIHEIEIIQKEFDRLKALSRAKLLRSASPEVVEKFEQIFDIIKQNKAMTPDQTKEILDKLDGIVSKLKKKMAIDVGNLIANAFSLVGLCLLLTVAPAALAFVFFAAAALLRILLLAYHDISLEDIKRFVSKAKKLFNQGVDRSQPVAVQ